MEHTQPPLIFHRTPFTYITDSVGYKRYLLEPYMPNENASLNLRYLSPLQRTPNLLPNLASLGSKIADAHVLHPSFFATSHRLKLTDNILQPKGFTIRLCGSCICRRSNMNNVNMEVGICGLI